MDNPKKRTKVQTFAASERPRAPQTVYVDCNRVHSFDDLLNPAARLNEVNTELKEQVRVYPGTTVQATSVTASSRGSGDVIEVPRDMSATLRIGYYLVHNCVNGSLVYSTARTLNVDGANNPRRQVHCVHLQTPGQNGLGEKQPLFFNTPPVKEKDVDPDTTESYSAHEKSYNAPSGNVFFVPLFTQATASVSCAKLLPITDNPISLPGNGQPPEGMLKVCGYKFASEGAGIIGKLSGDNKSIAPYYKKVTLKIPKGNYSPTDITSLLNDQISRAAPVSPPTAVQPNTSPPHELNYKYHSSARTVYEGGVQAWSDDIPAEVDRVIGINRDPTQHPAGPVGQEIHHWYFSKKTYWVTPKQEDEGSSTNWQPSDYPYNNTSGNQEGYSNIFRAKPVRLSKDQSFFHPITLGGLQPRFGFDTARSRFTITGLHQTFGELDFEELAYPNTQVIDRAGTSDKSAHTANRISLAAQAALGVDYSRKGGAFDGNDYAKPTQADGSDAMSVVGMVWPDSKAADAITHWNGAFVLSWWETEDELDFWDTLGFTNESIVKGSPDKTRGKAPVVGQYDFYPVDDLFDWWRQNKTDERVDDAIFGGRYPNVLGNTIYEPPFQQCYTLQKSLKHVNRTDRNSDGRPVPMYRGDPDAHPSTWSNILLGGWTGLFDVLGRTLYWHFAPPFQKGSGDDASFAPIGANQPCASNTRFVVSTNHNPIRAKDLARKLLYPEMLLVAKDLPIYPSQKHFLSNGYSHNVLSVLSKTFDTGDYFSSNTPGPQFTINEELSLNRFHLQLINPDGTTPSNLSGSIFVRLRFTIPPPPPTALPDVQQQQHQQQQEKEEEEEDGGGSTQAGQEDDA